MDAKPRLLELVRDKMRARHFSYRTEQAYVGWIKRFILYHGKRHPTDMGTPEVEAFLTHLAVGRRVSAALRLRVKDLDFEYSQIVVRDGKGSKDRVTILPESVAGTLQDHLREVKRQHTAALQRGYGGVELPEALANKYPNAPMD